MHYRISALVDCVAKKLLGSEENKALCINFLNAVLKPKYQIQDVAFINPYNDKSFIVDKLSVVDVKAIDTEGTQYQIEIQLNKHTDLPARMIYTWARVHSSQLNEGDEYSQLNPTIAIWLLDDTLITESSSPHHCFKAYDRKHNIQLHDGFEIHLLELPKWNRLKVSGGDQDLDQWMRFFIESEDFDPDNLPKFMGNPIMEQAMSVLRQFSEDDHKRALYESRLTANRKEATFLGENVRLKVENKRKDEALASKDEALASKDEALASKDEELIRLKQKLNDAGIK